MYNIECIHIFSCLSLTHMHTCSSYHFEKIFNCIMSSIELRILRASCGRDFPLILLLLLLLRHFLFRIIYILLFLNDPYVYTYTGEEVEVVVINVQVHMYTEDEQTLGLLIRYAIVCKIEWIAYIGAGPLCSLCRQQTFLFEFKGPFQILYLYKILRLHLLGLHLIFPFWPFKKLFTKNISVKVRTT